MAILDDDEEDDSDEDLGDWAKLETMSSSHPMYFAKKLAEVLAHRGFMTSYTLRKNI